MSEPNDTNGPTERDASESAATHGCPAPDCERTFADEEALRDHLRAVGMVD